MVEEFQSHVDGVENEPNNTANTETDSKMESEKKDISHVERVASAGETLKKEDLDLSRIDREVQEYALRGQTEVDEATSRRLRRMIDRRVLVIMVLTYFLQALDKGTMSFSSIMGIRDQLDLKNGQKVGLLGLQTTAC